MEGITVPIWEKLNLTIKEAAEYSGIGINKLRKMTQNADCDFVLMNGEKNILINRKRLERYLEQKTQI